jgi:hypothetical protein
MPNQDKPRSFFLAAVAFQLMSLGAGGVLGARALFADRPVAKAPAAVEPAAPEEAAAPPPRAARAERHGAPEPRMPDAPDLRSAVREVSAARVAEVHDAASLTGLLTELESAARAKGRVTAFEVEPGMAAIRALYVNDDAELQRRTHEFNERMSKLSASFQPPSGPSPHTKRLIEEQRSPQGETP